MYLEFGRESRNDLFMSPEKITFYTFFHGNENGVHPEGFICEREAELQLKLAKRNPSVKIISEIMPIEVTLNPNL